MYFYNSREWELYDLATDISEAKDLADVKPVRLRRLAERLQRKMDSMGAQWPIDRKTGKPDPLQLPAG